MPQDRRIKFAQLVGQGILPKNVRTCDRSGAGRRAIWNNHRMIEAPDAASQALFVQ
jgi:hypothetical protein